MKGMRKINVNETLKASSVNYEKGKFIVKTDGTADKTYVYQNGLFREE